MREMKESGITRIGLIPKTWDVIKTKYVCSLYTGNSIKDEEKDDYTDSSDAVPYIATKDIQQGFNTIDYNNGLYIKNADDSFVRASKGSTLMCIEGGSAGKKKALLDRTICFVNKLCCFSPNSINSVYLYYYLNSPQYEDEFRQNISGLIGGVSKSVLANILLVQPSREEQDRIADYLDAKCSQIDAIIEKQEQIIEKLKEYRSSVITESVTKGLNSKAEMKDSGISWVGEMPKGWECVISRLVFDTVSDINHFMPETVDNGYPYLMIGDLKEKTSEIDFSACKQVSKEDFEELRVKMQSRRGDIIFARYATIGTVCYVDTDDDFLVSYACVTVRPTKDKLDGRYLFYYFKSTAFGEEIKQYINSNTQGNVGIEALYKAKITIPPLDEQKTIAEYLDRKCSQIDRTISNREKIINRLQEYKKSLIYDVVTGKREV